jgi:hypothetical protein
MRMQEFNSFKSYINKVLNYYTIGGCMNKKRIIVIILLVALLGTGASGIWAYQYFITPDPIIEAHLEEEFTIDFFDFSSFAIPSTDSEVIEGEDAIIEDGKVTETYIEDIDDTDDTKVKRTQQSEDTSSARTQSTENKATAEADKAIKEEPSVVPFNPVTEEMIKKKYLPKFSALEESALERLDTLFNSAQLEFKQKKKDGNLNKTEFTRKYVQAANKLEDGVNSAFNQLLDNMKAELTKHNLSMEMIKDVKKQYKEAISTKKSEYLSYAINR